MCGVILTRSLERAEKLLLSVGHRGPDAQSLISQKIQGEDWYLGHARLAIVDLESGDQPTRGKSSWTAFNGEVFNYKDLSSKSEIELLSDLLEDSVSNVSLLSGYFAVVHLAVDKAKIFLIRDPIGVMPLYYCKKTWEVSSESFLLRDPVAVPPGTVVTLDLRSRKVSASRYYWVSSRTSQTFQVKSATDLFLTSLQRVAKHTEVDLALALSGGLDSQLLAKGLHALGINCTALTAYWDEDSVDLSRARQSAQDFGFEHVAVPLKELDWDYAQEHYTRTYNSSANLNNYIKLRGFLRQFAVAQKSPSKVILCGEGADEIDCGYPSHARATSTIGLAKKRHSVFMSQPYMTLDRVNQSGMAYSKEYRVPFLDLELVSYFMNLTPKVGKRHLRDIATYLGAAIPESKYTEEDRTLEKVLAKGIPSRGADD